MRSPRNPALRRWLLLAWHLAIPALSISRWWRYVSYWKQYLVYRMQASANREAVPVTDLYPCLDDNTGASSIDSHYFYVNIWAAKKIFASRTSAHVDVGSQIMFVGMLSAFTDVTFTDIRPLQVALERFHGKQGSILDLPFASNSISSLSCLHVAEHVGLGRYGDTLDPEGTGKACKELARVLAPSGNLYFAVPIGRPRTCFNAHRVHSVDQITQYFHALELREFAAIDDKGVFVPSADLHSLDGAEYGCGLFWFVKP